MTEQRDIARLPKWAQEHIADLARQRQVAVDALNEHLDQQTVSPFYIDEPTCTGEKQGPSIKRRYIQAHKIAVEFKGVQLEIHLRPEERGIDLGWSDLNRGLNDVALVPVSFNRVQIVAKGEMR